MPCWSTSGTTSTEQPLRDVAIDAGFHSVLVVPLVDQQGTLGSLVVLRRASVRFDAEKDFAKVKAKVLYVLSRTDKVFPPSIAPDAMAKMKAAGITADYFEIDSDFGHSASGLDAAKWAPRLRTFMAALEKRS